MTTPPKPDWISPCGRVTLYCGDCLEILPHLGKVDAVVTDPPYGIGKRLTSGGATAGWTGMVGSGAEVWDVVPTRRTLEMLINMSCNQIIWGGCFMDLPPTSKPLCWDKVRPNQKNASEWEFCWTSLVGRAQMFRYCANAGFILKEPRSHPTEKPVNLMVWCIGFLPDAQTILDPFMGSGTTGVACIKTGRKFIGIEIEPKYFEIAKRRIEQAIEQHDGGPMFSGLREPKQAGIFDQPLSTDGNP